ncbi:hypothetical protein GKZ90_0005435 [Flavobacterium sp. MC2016-06]|jgi:DNA-dependent RNA polymerase auxiliary subunit epsilon|uniref:hypothetical protein n=1 Tax=Flavobacterium sp. MC2016-06 TaxID=2676308 RepID=UPI0012BA9D2B|nr:hypothetical protein [Flavobacterium sp. MC2016-06]MBU3857579.1 hypothetical protein [Flavobacterium sp. MC2016-06]
MKKIENTAITVLSKKHFYKHNAVLKIGDWKNNFDLNYRNSIIAIALNHCCKHNDLIINGYLITTNNLYLVAKSNEKLLDAILNKLEHQINHLLKLDHKAIHKKKFNIDFIIDDEETFYEIQEPLFKIYPLKDDYLITLITGKKVTLPYFDRRLEDLKSMIQNHPFCSAIDYSGAIGPVYMTLLEE